MRSRVAVEAATSEKTTVRVEIQDSRTFGSEELGGPVPHTATIGNSKGVDFHQAYFILGLRMEPNLVDKK